MSEEEEPVMAEEVTPQAVEEEEYAKASAEDVKPKKKVGAGKKDPRLAQPKALKAPKTVELWRVLVDGETKAMSAGSNVLVKSEGAIVAFPGELKKVGGSWVIQ